jgi:hypothetical protein
MKHNHMKCEDEDDAARFAATILRELGYLQLAIGSNSHSVDYRLTAETLQRIAVFSERMGRWARDELKRRNFVR